MSVSEMDQSVFNETQVIDLNDTALRRKLETDFELLTPMKPANGEEDSGQSDHMKVYLRVRPLTDGEIAQKEDQGCMSVSSKHMLEAKAPKDSHTFKNSQHGCGKQTHRFTFSSIFGADTSQKEFFDATVLDIVKDFIDGQNSLIFTYGVTNSGKTYTIQGIPKDGGILPRTLDVLFNSISDKQWPNMALKPKLYQEVSKLSPEHEAQEQKIKEKVFRMASADEPDMMSLLGDSDLSQITVNSTMSQDSLFDSSGRNSSQSIAKDAAETSLEEDGGPRLQEVLAELDERVREEAAVSVSMQGLVRFSVWVSFSEIYNEQIFDLLEPIPKKKTTKRTVLQLREDKHGTPYIKGLKEICVNSADEAYKILTIGKQNLQFAGTKLNHNSSRSHCIFTIKVIRVVDKNNPHLARVSRLTFCDLAGAERSTKTQATGDRIKEAGNINTSLLALGRCIQMLRYNQHHKDQAAKIVPFRDSKLTRLFQSFFCGQGKAAMIVNINQCASYFDETLHALKYSAVAKQVIVTQEAPKTVKKRPPPAKSERLLSLALAGGSKSTRDTMAWETPNTLAKFAEMEEDAVNLPLPIGNFVTDPDEEGDSDDTISPAREQELIDLIYYLKDRLLEKKKESKTDKKKIKELEKRMTTLEAKIRKEVVEEMSKQLVEMEAEYDEMINETKATFEEYAESRIEMYVEHFQKQQNLRKRRRVEEEENEDDEMVSGIFLFQAETKVEELEKELAAVKAEYEASKAHLCNVIEERDDILKDNSKLQFEYASSRTLQAHQAENSEPKEVIAKLHTQIEDLKTELEEKVNECAELSETLKEAGETFLQKEEELKELRALVSDYDTKCKGQEESQAELQQLLEESRAAMVDAEQRLKAKQDYIQELEQSPEGCAECQKSTMRLAEVVGKLADCEEVLDARIQDLEKDRTELGEVKQTLTDTQQCLKDTEKLLEEAKTDASNKDVQLKEKEGQLEDKEFQLQEHKMALEDAGKKENRMAELEGEVKKLSDEIDALKTTEQNLHKEKDELESGNKSLERSKNKIEKDLLESENRVGKLEKEIKELKDLLKNQETEGSRNEKLVEKTKELEEQLKEAKKAAKEKVSKLEDSEERQKELEKFKDDVASILGVNGKHSKQKEATLMRDVMKRIESMKQKVKELTKKLEEKTEKYELSVKDTKQKQENLQALEDSLQHANSAVREKSLECDELQKKLEASEEIVKTQKDEVMKLESKCDETHSALSAAEEMIQSLKTELQKLHASLDEARNAHEGCDKKIQNLHKQLDDYILKVNEQAEEVGELKDKLKDASVDASKREKDEKELAAKTKLNERLQRQVDDLSNRLASERKQHKGAVKEMDDLVQTKIIHIEELSSTITDLKNSLKSKQAEIDALKEKELDNVQNSSDIQVSFNVSNFENILKESEEKLTHVQGELNRSQARVSDLEKKLESNSSSSGNKSQRGTKMLEDKLQAADSRITELEKQIGDLKSHHEEELEELKGKQNKELNNLEHQLKDLKEKRISSDSIEVKEDEVSVEEFKKLRAKCRELENVAREAEYSAQMVSRQVRREKVVVEEKVKEKDVLLKEKEKKIILLERKIREQTDKIKELEESDDEEVDISLTDDEKAKKDVEDLRKKVSRLENVVQEFETCLKSAKSSQAAAEETAERFKKKCKNLEEQVDDLQEQQVLGLETSMHDAEQERATLRRQWRDEVGSLEDQVYDLQHQVREGQAEMSSLKEKLVRFDDLQADFDKVVKDLEKCEEELKVKESDINDLEEKVKVMTIDLQAKDNEVKVTKDEIEKMTNNLEEVKESKNQKGSAELSDLKSQIKEWKSENKKQKTQAEEMQDILATYKSDLESKVSELEGAATKVGELESQISELSSAKDSAEKELEALKNTQTNDETKLSELQQARDSLQKKLEDLEERHAQSEESMNSLKKKIEELEQQVKDLQEKNEQLKDSEEAVRDTLHALKSELKGEKDTMSKLRADLTKTHGHESDLSDQMKQMRQELEKERGEVGKLSEEMENLKKEHRSATDESSAKLEDLQTEKGELEKTLKDAKKDLAAKEELETELSKLRKEINNQKEMEKELSALKVELDSKKEVEKEVKQMKKEIERKEKLEKDLEDLQHSITTKDKIQRDHEERLATARSEMATLKMELSCKESAIKEAMSERNIFERRLGDEKSRLEREIEHLNGELTSKETKIKKQLSSLKEYAEMLESERKSYEVALRDAQANERMIEEMKAIMEEQDATMETQDKVLRSKEERIDSLSRELDHQLQKYEELMASNQKSKQKLRELEIWQSRTESEKLQRAGDEEGRINKSRFERDEARKEKEDAETRREMAEKRREEADKKRRAAESEKRDLDLKVERLEEEKTEIDKRRRELEREMKEESRLRAEVQSELERAKKSIKSQATRGNLEQELLSTNQELINMESMLKEARQELEQLRSRQEEMRGRTNSVSSVSSTGTLKDSRINVLKSKFQVGLCSPLTKLKVLEERNEELVRELEKSEAQLKRQEQSHLQQLDSWRKDKDELVKQLERILKQKDATIKELHDKMGSGTTGSQDETITRLQEQLKDKEETISELSQHLDKDLGRPARGRRTRGKTANRTVENESAIDDSASESLKNEVNTLYRQCSTEAEHLDQSQSMSNRRKTRGRPRKRKSSEHEKSMDIMSEENKPRKKKSVGRRAKKSMQLQVSFDENDQDFMRIKEEDLVNLSSIATSTPASVPRSALANKLNTSDAGLIDTPMERVSRPTFLSPDKSIAVPKKKKHKLRGHQMDPFNDSPELTDVIPDTPDAHKIVTRQLRSRQVRK